MKLKESLINLQCEMVAERAQVNPQNISWLQYDILFQLQKVETILPSELSLILGVSRAKLSKALKDLKSEGYITQSPNPEDGRELCTSITSEGKRLLSDISARHTALYQTARDVMSREEQAEFARLANRLSEALSEKRRANEDAREDA